MNPVIDFYYGLTMEDFLSAEEIAEILSRKELTAEEYAAFMDFASGEVSCNV